jgi:hypothetical protein
MRHVGIRTELRGYPVAEQGLDFSPIRLVEAIVSVQLVPEPPSALTLGEHHLEKVLADWWDGYSRLSTCSITWYILARKKRLGD